MKMFLSKLESNICKIKLSSFLFSSILLLFTFVSVSQTKETPVLQTKEGPVSQTKETTVSKTEETTVSQTKETSVETTEETPVEKTGYQNPEHSDENYMALNKGWFFGIDAGTTLFYGDIALYNNFPKLSDYKKSFGTGISIYGGKKFKFGLSAELQVFNGTLKGEKQSGKLYPRYFNADIMGYSLSAKYNLSHLFFREKNDRKFFNRLTLYLTVGVGQIFFRSRLYKLANNGQWYLEKVSGYSTTGIDSAGVNSAGGLVTSKIKTVSAITLPIGGKLNFKLNQKTDIVFDISYVTVFSDQVDAWSRSWSHKDRYLYTGIGLMYNFGNQKDEDIPEEDRLLRPHSKKLNDAYDSKSVSQTSGTNSAKTGLFKKKAKKEDKDLEIKLKLYELQLKLFEMQYLIH